MEAAGETAGTQPGPGFRSLREVLGAVSSAMGFLAGVDMAQLPGECLAEVLTVMEQVDAAQAAVRGRTVEVFNDKHIHSEFGHKATSGWLMHYTGVTRGKANQVSGLANFAHHHPVLRAGLTPGCATLLREVLDILGRRNGKDDNRSKEERDHDALEQACKLLPAPPVSRTTTQTAETRYPGASA